VLRATAGLAWSYSPAVRMEVDILSPTVWILPGTAAVSLDVGAQLIWDFGAGSGAGSGSGPPRMPRRPSIHATTAPAAATGAATISHPNDSPTLATGGGAAASTRATPRRIRSFYTGRSEQG
jgi:hypothetical protein